MFNPDQQHRSHPSGSPVFVSVLPKAIARLAQTSFPIDSCMHDVLVYRNIIEKTAASFPFDRQAGLGIEYSLYKRASRQMN